MKHIQKYFILYTLVFIVCLASFLRIYKVSSIPVSLYWDETASAYNAYSIAMTGKDEYGVPFPLLFRSFDDYKMPGSIYMSAAMVRIFGLNEFSARASSVLAGILTVLLTYFLIKELLSLEKIKNKRIIFLEEHKSAIALWSAGLLAISPWHIQFSRTGFEANIGLFFVVLGVHLFIKSIKNHIYILISFFVMGVSMYFYRSVIIFFPLLILCLFLLYLPELLIKHKKQTGLGILIFLLIISPMFFAIISDTGLKRFKQVSITNTVSSEAIENAQKIQKNGNRLVDRIFYNRRILIVKDISLNYLSHFSPSFLFLKGDSNGRHHVWNMGQIYFWQSIGLLFGLYILFHYPKKIRFIVLAWILLAPIPASFSAPAPHALRSLNMLPMPSFISALGIVFLLYHTKSKYKFIVNTVLSTVILGSFIFYLYSYYIITPPKTASDWGDGYKQLTTYIISRENQYDKIIVSGHYWQPYIYILFYKHYDPAAFQKLGSQIAFDKYYFGGTSWDQDRGRQELDKEDLQKIAKHKKTLVALSPTEFAVQKEHLAHVKEITDSFGKTIFLVGDLQ